MAGIGVLLELEAQSCRGIHALRSKYRWKGPFFIFLRHKFVYNRSNFSILEKQLPKLAAARAPFDIELCDLHRAYTKSGDYTIKYCLHLEDLEKLRADFRTRLAGTMVFDGKDKPGFRSILKQSISPRTLRQDMDLNPKEDFSHFYVPIRKNLINEEEADQALHEIEEIDIQTLGPLKAIGLRMSGHRPRHPPFQHGIFFPFRQSQE
jgi:hypothetical protein